MLLAVSQLYDKLWNFIDPGLSPGFGCDCNVRIIRIKMIAMPATIVLAAVVAIFKIMTFSPWKIGLFYENGDKKNVFERPDFIDGFISRLFEVVLFLLLLIPALDFLSRILCAIFIGVNPLTASLWVLWGTSYPLYIALIVPWLTLFVPCNITVASRMFDKECRSEESLPPF